MLPKTSLTTGYDTHGRFARLGMIDSDGYRVRYIAPDGLAHESHYAAEYNELQGRIVDAYTAWRSGRGPRPDPFAMAEEICSPENRDDALVDSANALRFWCHVREVRGLTFCGELPDEVDPTASWGTTMRGCLSGSEQSCGAFEVSVAPDRARRVASRSFSKTAR